MTHGFVMPDRRRESSRRTTFRDGRRSGHERRTKTVEPTIDYRNHDLQRRETKRRVVIDRRNFFRGPRRVLLFRRAPLDRRARDVVPMFDTRRLGSRRTTNRRSLFR